MARTVLVSFCIVKFYRQSTIWRSSCVCRSYEKLWKNGPVYVLGNSKGSAHSFGEPSYHHSELATCAAVEVPEEETFSGDMLAKLLDSIGLKTEG